MANLFGDLVSNSKKKVESVHKGNPLPQYNKEIQKHNRFSNDPIYQHMQQAKQERIKKLDAHLKKSNPIYSGKPSYVVREELAQRQNQIAQQQKQQHQQQKLRQLQQDNYSLQHWRDSLTERQDNTDLIGRGVVGGLRKTIDEETGKPVVRDFSREGYYTYHPYLGLKGEAGKLSAYSDWYAVAASNDPEEWSTLSEADKKAAYIAQTAAKELLGKKDENGNVYDEDFFNNASILEIEQAYNKYESIKRGEKYKPNRQEMLDSLSIDLGSEGGEDMKKTILSKFNEIADKGSAFYRRYVSRNEGDVDKSRFSMSDQAKLNAVMQGISYAYEKNDPNQVANFVGKAADSNIQNNQPWYEKTWYGVKGFGRDAYSTAVQLGGMAYGLVKAEHTLIDRATGNDGSSDDKNLSLGAALSRDILNNSIDQYAYEMIEYGDVNPDKIMEIKYGLRKGNPLIDAELMRLGIKNPTIYDIQNARRNVIKNIENGKYSQDLLRKIQNENTLGNDEQISTNDALGYITEGFKSYGFTAATMFLSGGTSTLLNAVTKGANFLAKGEKAMSIVNKFAKAGQAYGVPIVMATMESGQNAYQAGERILSEGYDTISKNKNAFVERQINKDLNNNVLRQSAAKKLGLQRDKNGGYLYKENGQYYKVSNAQAKQLIDQQITLDRTALHEQEYAPIQKDFERKIVENAAIGQGTNFAINMAELSLINATLKGIQQVPRVRNAMASIRRGMLRRTPEGGIHFNRSLFGTSKVGSKVADKAERAATRAFGGRKKSKFTTAESNGNWEVKAKPLTSMEKAKLMTKEMWGESIEEASQNAFEGLSVGGAMNDFKSYMDARYDKDGRKRTEKEFKNRLSSTLENIGASLSQGIDDFFSEDTLDAMIMAAISTGMGGPNVNVKHKVFGGKEKNLFTWRSGIYEGYKEAKEISSQRAEVAKQLQNTINSKQVRAMMGGQVGAYSYAKAVVEAAENNDEMGVRDSKLGQIISLSQAMHELGDTEWAKKMQDELDLQASLTKEDLQDELPTDDNKTKLRKKQAKAMLNDYKSHLIELGETKENLPSDDKLIEQLAKNAQKTNEVFDQIAEVGQNIDLDFGVDIDSDVRKSLIHSAILNKDRIIRRDKLQQEVNEVENKVRQSLPVEDPSTSKYTKDGKEINTTIGGAKKRIIVRYGSYENMMDSAKKADEQLAKIKAARKKAKSPEDMALLDMSEKVWQTEKDDIKKYKKAYDKEVGNSTTTSTDNQDKNDKKVDVITASEIANLSAEDKAYMLNPNHREDYSEEQKEEIEKYEREAKQNDENYLSKVRDLNRINKAIKRYENYRKSIFEHTDSFDTYAQKVRNAVAARDILNSDTAQNLIRLSKGVDEEGNEIADKDAAYKQFKEAYNKWKENATDFESAVINNQLREEGGDNYTRVASENATKEGILDTVEGANDKDIIRLAFKFLEEKGVDFRDKDSVYTALSGDDKKGTEFLKYLEDYNKTVDNESDKIELEGLTIDKINGTYKKAIDDYENKQKNIKDLNARSVDDDSDEDTDESNNDKDKDYHYLIDNLNEDEKKLVDKFSQNLQENVAAILLAAKPVKEDKEATNQYNKTIETLNKLINEKTIDISKVDSIDKLRNILNDLINNKIEKVKLDDSTRIVLTKIVNKAEAFRQSSYKIVDNLNLQGGNTNANSPFIDSVNVEEIIHSKDEETQEIYKELINWYKSKDIEETLNRLGSEHGGENKDESKKVQVVFYKDKDLTDAVKAVFEKQKKEYKESTDIPIVIAVKEGNTLTPIGILSNVAGETKGSDWVKQIRENAASNNDNEEITDSNGNVITTTVENFHASNPGFIPKGQPNRSVKSLLNEESKNSSNANEAPGIWKVILNNVKSTVNKVNSIYNAFLNKVKIVEKPVVRNGEPTSIKKLVYELSNQNGDTYNLLLTVPEISELKNDAGKTLVDYLNSADESEREKALTFNSRINDLFYKKSNNKSNNLISNLNESLSKHQSEADDKEELAKLVSKDIRQFINRYLYVNPSYSIDVGITDDGIVTLQLTHNGNVVSTLCTFNNETSKDGSISRTLPKEEKIKFLKNLITDKEGNVRITTNNNIGKGVPLVKWNVDFENFAGTTDYDRNYAKKIIDAGLVEISVEGLNYQNHKITIKSPFSSEKTQKKTAQPTVDSDTGTSTSPGSYVPPKQGPTANREKAEEIVEKIKKDKNKPELKDPNADTYESKDKNGKTIHWQRVTSIIHYAKDYVKSKFNEHKTPEQIKEETEESRKEGGALWAASIFGNTCDQLVRDFFDKDFGINEINKLSDEEKHKRYPNISKNDLDRFIQQLVDINRNYFESRGITIVSSGITLYGQVTVKDENGKEHNINVAGTVDLLGYDSKGNFHIFDMKTFHGKMDEDKQKNYALQLKAYKQLLTQQYLQGTDLEVVETKLIPIKVDYPLENGKTGLQKGSNTGSNQLYDSKGKEFNSLNPRILLFEKRKDNSGNNQSMSDYKPVKAVGTGEILYSPKEVKEGRFNGGAIEPFVDVSTKGDLQLDYSQLPANIKEGEKPEIKGGEKPSNSTFSKEDIDERTEELARRKPARRRKKNSGTQKTQGSQDSQTKDPSTGIADEADKKSKGCHGK